MEADGQIIIPVEEVQFMRIGSQHPVENGRIIDGEGDGVIIPETISEQSASPGVHGPRVGSQHLIPLKFISPVF